MDEQRMTQAQIILDYIEENGSITRVDAANEGIFELAARINDLERKGFVFRKEPFTGISKRGNKFRCKRYFLEGISNG